MCRFDFKIFFKLKKVIISGEELQGILVPIIKKNLNSKEIYLFDTEKVMFITLEGIEYVLYYEKDRFKQTKISNKNIREHIQHFIETYKEIYKEQKKYIKAYEKASKLKQNALRIEENKKNSILNIISDIAKCNNLLSIKEIKNIVNKKRINSIPPVKSKATIMCFGKSITELTITQTLIIDISENLTNLIIEDNEHNCYIDNNFLPENKYIKKLSKKYFYKLNKHFVLKDCIVTDKIWGYISKNKTITIDYIITISFNSYIDFSENSLKYLNKIISFFNKWTKQFNHNYKFKIPFI